MTIQEAIRPSLDRICDARTKSGGDFFAGLVYEELIKVYEIAFFEENKYPFTTFKPGEDTDSRLESLAEAKEESL